MKRVQLCLERLPTFETSPMFLTLDEKVEKRLKELPNTYERARAALRFCQKIGADRKALGVSEEEVHIMSVAYLRAALMEFVAMEEVLPKDLAVVPSKKPVRIYDTENTLLILLRELRHLQLHVENIHFNKTNKRAVMYTKSKGEVLTTQVEILTIPLVTLCKLRMLRNASKFEPKDLDAAIEWFNDAQKQWGIVDVVVKGIQLYSAEIVRTCV